MEGHVVGSLALDSGQRRHRRMVAMGTAAGIAGIVIANRVLHASARPSPRAPCMAHFHP